MPSDNRHFWIFDRTVYDQIELPSLQWQEVALVLAALLALVAYVAGTRYLEHRSRTRRQRARQRARLGQWLERAELTQQEREALADLAGGEAPVELYHLLGNPVRFETRIHEAIQAGHGGHLRFTDALRDVLGYHSDNLRIPLASTRQLLPGDAVRVTPWVAGLPRHFYGQVAESGLETLVLSLRPEGVETARQHASETDIYVVRGGEVEYRFPCHIAPVGHAPGQLVVYHALVALDHGPRATRLPLMRDIRFEEQEAGDAGVIPEGDAVGEEGMGEQGILFDLSEGGFALVSTREVEAGHYVHFQLPLKRGRRSFHLTGRVVESRPFGGTQWLVRCQVRGLTQRQRNLLQQIVRMEQKRRMEAMAPVMRQRTSRPRKASSPPAGPP